MLPTPRPGPESERTIYVLSDDDPSLSPKPITPIPPPSSFIPHPELVEGHPSSLFNTLFPHLLALLITAGYFFFLYSFFAPAPSRPGIDENAYLVAGRMIADHASPSLHPPHPLSFVGAMWVLSSKTGLYYPKYPAGLPLLHALLLLTTHSTTPSFLLSPICAALSIYVLFLLARRVTSSFHALLAMIVLATNVATLQLSEQPNSHAPCLLFTLAGMFFLFRYLQSSAKPRASALGSPTPNALLAGFLLGYAVTIRYSQGLNLLPLLAAAFLTYKRPPSPRSRFSILSSFILHPSSLLIPWLLPVATLAAFNYLTLGHLSGYGATHESTGFTLAEFSRKWEFAVDQLNRFGLFFIGPVGLLGLITLFRKSPRIATIFLLWFLPGTLLYFSYYWGQDIPGVGFLRFFLDLLPPLLIAAFTLLDPLPSLAAPLAGRVRYRSISLPLAAALLTLIPSTLGLRASLPEIDRQHVGNLNLSFSAQSLLSHLHPSSFILHPSPKPVIFADTGMFPQFLMYAQFLTNADFYATDAFIPRFGGGFGFLGLTPDKKDDSPVLIDDNRLAVMKKYYRSRSQKDLIHEQHAIINDALDHHRPVYLLLTNDQLLHSDYQSTFITPPYRATEIDHWTEPAGTPSTPPSHLLTPPSWRINLVINWTPQSYHLFQITHSPTTQPTTLP